MSLKFSNNSDTRKVRTCDVLGADKTHATPTAVVSAEYVMMWESRSTREMWRIGSGCDAEEQMYRLDTVVIDQTWLTFWCLRTLGCELRHKTSVHFVRSIVLMPMTDFWRWLRRGHGTACRDLSSRYLHWRPLDVSWIWSPLFYARRCGQAYFLVPSMSRFVIVENNDKQISGFFL